MRFEAFVAARYLRSKRKTRFVSLITVISIAGVSVGVVALIVVMSVMTGFDNELRAAIIGNRAHLTVQDYRGRPFEDYQAVISEVEGLCPEIAASSPVIEIQALLKRQGDRAMVRQTGAFVLGIDPRLETRVTQLEENLTRKGGRTYSAGSLPRRKEIVLGYLLADDLGVHVGDELTVFTGRAKVTPFGLRGAQELVLRVSGISQARMADFDSLYAFVDLETARMLTGMEGIHAVHCRLTDPFLAASVAERIERELVYRAVTWKESQEAFFEALRQEKLAMFIILVFIILVAAFNITSTLIMVVMEKRRDIGILRTLGVSNRSVLQLFMLEGLYIGLSGTIIGVVAGTVLARYLNPVAEFIAWMFNIDLFNQQIYYFDHIPVDVVPGDVFWVTVSAVMLTFLSTLYPAWSASRLDPVDALRYE
jgi:lipoprotein-releasing system permease protein